MYILGISAFFHDSAACLLRDGNIVAAAQEERFSRKKNDASFPAAAIRYCLEEAGISLREVRHVVFYEKPFLKFERLLETYLSFAPRGLFSFLRSMPLWLKEKLFLRRSLMRFLREIDPHWGGEVAPRRDALLFSTHHLSHAASAFFPSPFSDALILTADGVGEWATTTVARGEGNRIRFLKELRFPHSIGLLYSAFTYYLGFAVNSDEYKVMGLAPYGRPVYSGLILDRLVHLKPDGTYRLAMEYFDYCTGLTMISPRWEKLFGAPRRLPGEALTDFHKDIARSVQDVTERILVALAAALYREYGVNRLCLSGGVALNCVANARIREKSGFKDIWVQPAAGDAGGALGAAYAVWHHHLDEPRLSATELLATVYNHAESGFIEDLSRDMMKNALLGPAYSRQTVEAALAEADLPYTTYGDEDLFTEVAKLLAAGKVVGYFRGRMEWGPRALGNRSILADPRDSAMQSLLNKKIKFRESFRPFAPAVPAEMASQYFELGTDGPANASRATDYMLLTAPVREDKRSLLPAITHVDGSARVQTVDKQNHPAFHRLLMAFYAQTGCHVLINTSFNRMDEPIVNSPQDAIGCFLGTDMDVLVLENCVVIKGTGRE